MRVHELVAVLLNRTLVFSLIDQRLYGAHVTGCSAAGIDEEHRSFHRSFEHAVVLTVGWQPVVPDM